MQAAKSPRANKTLAALVSAVLIGCSLLSTDDRQESIQVSASRPTRWQSPAFKPPLLPMAEPYLHDDPNEREKWFAFQRFYPGGLPEAARLRAWDSIKRGRLQLRSASPDALAWRAIGPSPTQSAFPANWGPTSGRVNAIAVSPANPRVVIAGSATGGIWRSGDGGESFAPASDNQVDLAVGSIAFSRSNSSIVYAGMGDSAGGYLGSGVLKSTNAGRSWTRISDPSLPSPATVSKVEVDPADPSRVYAGLSSRLSNGGLTAGGLYLSTNGGASWSRSLSGRARDLAIDPADRRALYAALTRVDGGAGSLEPGVLRSTDAGVSWSTAFASPYDPGRTRDVRVALSAASPGTVFAYLGGFIGNDFDLRFMVSTDRGVTWLKRSADQIDPGQFGYNTFLCADPSSPGTLYVGARDLFKSTDGGASWTNLTGSFSEFGPVWVYTPESSNSHPDQHALACSPSDPRELYLGNDGGVSKSTDGGITFRSMNSTLTLSQFIGIAIHPTNPLITYGGTQDNGTQRRLGGGAQWAEFSSGDGGHPVIDPLNPATVFVTYVRGDIYRYYDNGRVYDTQIASNGTFGEGPGGAGRIAFYPPFTGNGVDSTLYFGTWRLFTSTDRGNSWSTPAGDTDLTKGITAAGRDVVTAIGVARSDNRVIYTGSSQGRVMVSRDGGAEWSDITQGLPDRYISSVTVEPTSSAVAYVTVSGFDSGHVFKTTNGGVAWEDVSRGLPNIPANALLIDPGSRDVLYLGTDVGVFRSTSGGGDWQLFNEGMPPVIVYDFAAQASGLIQTATYGRGVFEMDTSGSRPSISSVELSGKRLTILGARFTGSARVIINGTDRSELIRSATDSAIKLKGTAARLGLVTGDNTVQVIGGGLASNTFVLKL